ncbi:MAG: polysaccharide biosynthesis/export family protein [Flavobacteriaceae bacterium]
MNQHFLVFVIALFLLQSCASKKDIVYFQDNYAFETLEHHDARIMVNDILKIEVSAAIPEIAMPYNTFPSNGVAPTTAEALKLQGYLVTANGEITFPVLGTINVKGMTTKDVEAHIVELLSTGGHIKDAVVHARIVNAKVTILGEVNLPGTYNFTEQNITLPQALGYAGDLTINGQRHDVMVIRQQDGVREIGHIDMTKTDWFNNEYYYVQQNDVIVVHPNNPKVKSAGFVGNAVTILSIVSILLSTAILITR